MKPLNQMTKAERQKLFRKDPIAFARLTGAAGGNKRRERHTTKEISTWGLKGANVQRRAKAKGKKK